MRQKNFGKEHYLGEKHKPQWNIDSLYKLDCAAGARLQRQNRWP
jgi:hypothetical protein